jgi:WS/DGAT/MGAT family acyltransferase
MQQLTGLDASFIYLETPNAPLHVFSVYIYDQSTAPGGKVTFKGILDHVRNRLHISRTFRQKLVQVPFGLDHPYWIKDPNFDLEYHIRHIALPKPGDWRQFCIQVARLHSRHLDLNKPLWEMYVIEGLDNIEGLPPGSFAIMNKTHHAAIDGVSLIEITSAIHDKSPEATPPLPTEEWKPDAEPEPWELVTRAAWNNTTRPFRFLELLARTTPRMQQLREQLQRPEFGVPHGPAPRTRFSGNVTTHRVVEARRFSLDMARRIKSAVPGATVNDVAVAVVGGALRNYLLEKGELPSESLRAVLPISIRTSEQAGTAGNQVSAMVALLRTDIEDPKQRLAAVRESTHTSKAFSEATGARDLVQFSEFLPGGLTALAARAVSQYEMATRIMPVTINTIVSNVPGPQVPLYMAGARMVTYFGGAGVVNGMGLLHGVTSYCGQLIMSVVSCREIMPDPGHYGDLLEESFQEMAAATGAAKPAAAAQISPSPGRRRPVRSVP